MEGFLLMSTLLRFRILNSCSSTDCALTVTYILIALAFWYYPGSSNTIN